MTRQYSGELDVLKKEFDAYRLPIEIRKLKDRLQELEKAFDMACERLGVNACCPEVGMECPDMAEISLDCVECWKKYLLQKAGEEE